MGEATPSNSGVRPGKELSFCEATTIIAIDASAAAT
jgi:hypothetical protein